MKIKLILIFILFFIFNLPASDEERLNTLPLGPSKFKNFLITIGNKQIIETSSGKVVSISDMIEKNKNTDIFIIGEFHNSYSCHEFQRDFIEALVKTYPKIIVGFEFFKRSDDVVLEQWRKGEISEKELIEKTGWYRSKSFNYGYTKIIMDVIKKHRINAIGLNIPRKIVRRVSTRGFNSLSEQEKKLFPGINTPSIEHKYYIKSIFGKPAVQSEKWFENVYSAQKCWDIVMAESMTKILQKKKFRKYKGVIIAGSVHASYKLGIPFRLYKSMRKKKVTTLIPVYLQPEKNEKKPHPMMKMLKKTKKPVAIFSRGIGDYVFSAFKPKNEHFPVIGFQGWMGKDGTYRITDVKDGSIAEKNGFETGNIIIAVDGTKIHSIEQLRLLLSRKRWGDSVEFEIRKSIQLKK